MPENCGNGYVSKQLEIGEVRRSKQGWTSLPSLAGVSPAKKYNAEWRKKIHCLGVLTFFKQGL